VLYGRNDVFHLWHPSGTGGRQKTAYFRARRPVRCEEGLVREASPGPGPEPERARAEKRR
jgi:hypothetical protein